MSSPPKKRFVSSYKAKLRFSKKPKVVTPPPSVTPSPEPSMPSASSSETACPSTSSSKLENPSVSSYEPISSCVPSSASKSTYSPGSAYVPAASMSEDSEDRGYSPSASVESESVSLSSSPSTVDSQPFGQPSPAPPIMDKGKCKVFEESPFKSTPTKAPQEKPSSRRFKSTTHKDKVCSDRNILSSKFVPPKVFIVFEGHDLLF